jgi:hypothetical protein
MTQQIEKELIHNIREWIQLDNEIKELQREIKIRKTKQQEKTLFLMEIMKKNQLDAVNVPGGRLAQITRKSKQPITKKTLLELLSKYYQNDLSQAITINNFVQSNRELITKDTIIFKPMNG